MFSKIDLCSAYNLLRIKEGDEHLTALRTKSGSFEYLVIPFGLTNAPASSQNLVNDIFQDLLDVYIVVYLDDIMVFSKSEEEHVTHASTVLCRLRANNLFALASKCLFHVSSVEYLGYVVSSEGLKMDQEKVQQILNWPPPRNLKALESFLSFANFYHHFIKNYSKKINSLTNFLKKYSCFHLNEEALSQFHHLFNPSLPTIVETNASNYALGAVLRQVSDSGKHPISFNSCKLIPAELNYEIHEKELLAIAWALKHWRAFSLSLSSPFEVLTDHSSLQYFMYSKVLTRRQARWAEILSEFHFSITYRPGRLATLPDSLSYRVVVPNDPTIQLSITQKGHYSPLAGHPGKEKTLKLVKWDFHWSGIPQFIKDYVSSCQQCSRNKNMHHKKFGLLRPLTIPNGPWICLSMYFITQLPLSKSFDSILVIVDRFSTMAVFIQTMSLITSLDLAHLFMRNIFSNNGLPSSIVSDRGPLFVSSFWTNLCKQLKNLRDLSTSYHPETDGQTERVNQILEQYLWMDVSYHEDNWNTWLPLAEVAYNNSDHSSTKKSPFFTVYGRDPQFDSAPITQDNPAGMLSTKIQSVKKDVKRELEAAINQFKRYADKGRASPPDFNHGDMVWLSSKNIKSTRPTKNLSERWLGPIPILNKVSTHAYHLKLPSQWRSIHPVFHISLLEPVKTSTIPNLHQKPPPPIIIEEEEEWEVSQILHSKLKRRRSWHLVEWKGFIQDSE
ncbi:hypothetical protein O181_063763 [Austropuccinia psidii MF-1]|uniref:Integrase catalytic domain-containing protein n=1 Tax=Austropuccinia psidii MF-1 TaxID=1389203 RepID=A0A9Q3I0X2_9BASI|nr:hypothetical protein [Austropuccinia psidii MF-1]